MPPTLDAPIVTCKHWLRNNTALLCACVKQNNG